MSRRRVAVLAGASGRGHDTSMDPSGNTRTIARHALQVGLCALVPVPLLDSALEARAAERLVRTLADAHALALTPEAVLALAQGQARSPLGRAAQVGLLLPLKRLLRTAFLVLGLHSAARKASVWLERGLLIDWAFDSGWCEPVGKHSAAALRQAIDEVLDKAAGGPIEQAARALLRETPLVSAEVSRWLRRQLGALGKRQDGGAGPPEEPGLEAIATELADAVNRAEQHHFDERRAALAAWLGEPRRPAGGSTDPDRAE